MSTSAPRKALNLSNINPHVKKAEYAVRGAIPIKSEEYRKLLAAAGTVSASGSDSATPNHNLPFNNVISANIGNPQQLGQKPLTFIRQVLSILEYPALLEHEGLFPKDVRERAKWLLEQVGSVGAYSQSQGCFGLRKSVARFIEG
jgi:alanine transaminase